MEPNDILKHHVRLTYFAWVIAVVVIIFGGYIVLHTMQSYEHELAVAETHNQEYRQQLDESRKQIKEDEQTILDLSKQQKVVETRIVERDKQTAAKVAEVTAPDRSLDQTQNDFQTYLAMHPDIIGNKLAFTQQESQTFIANKLELDNKTKDYDDLKTIYGMEQQLYGVRGEELQTVQKSLDSCNTTLNDYKKVAKKSLIRRVIGKVGDYAGGAVVGIIVGKALHI